MKRYKLFRTVLCFVLLLTLMYPAANVQAKEDNWELFIAKFEEVLKETSYADSFQFARIPGWNGFAPTFTDASSGKYYTATFIYSDGVVTYSKVFTDESEQQDAKSKELDIDFVKYATKAVSIMRGLSQSDFEGYWDNVIKYPNSDIRNLKNGGLELNYSDNTVQSYKININGDFKYAMIPEYVPNESTGTGEKPVETPVPSPEPTEEENPVQYPAPTKVETVDKNKDKNEDKEESPAEKQESTRPQTTTSSSQEENPNTGIYYGASLLLIVVVFSGIFYLLIFKKNKFSQI